MLMFDLASHVYNNAIHEGLHIHSPYVAVVDYAMPSTSKRLFLFDIKNNKLVYRLRVAHGKNSGLNYATKFSNRPTSDETSLGVFLTGDSYYGHDGYSMRLRGLTPHFNTNAYSRTVVVHGAWYMKDSFIDKMGRAGRSWGCPALAPSKVKAFIDQMKGGSLFVAYYPNPQLMHTAPLMRGAFEDDA